MAWTIYKLSSGFNSLDNSELDADYLPALYQTLKKHFGSRLRLGSKMGLEILSAIAGDILIDGVPLTVGWDNWSGIFIMAESAEGNAVLDEIRTLL